jgi:hypothetical protein
VPSELVAAMLALVAVVLDAWLAVLSLNCAHETEKAAAIAAVIKIFALIDMTFSFHERWCFPSRGSSKMRADRCRTIATAHESELLQEGGND